ncbi:MAG: hypothetical protein WC544_01875 [Patescibacteria group bacterium]
MFRRTLACICLVGVLGWSGCLGSSDEPPFDFGDGPPGSMARKTELKDFDPPSGRIVYEVQYPLLRLTSMATLSLSMKEMVSEVFDGQWSVKYLYEGIGDRYLHRPTTIEVYRYAEAGDHFGDLINTYTYTSITLSGEVLYTDRLGKTRLIDLSYFDILPSGS